MHCYPRYSASGNSASGHPQHLGVIALTVAQKGMNCCMLILANHITNADVFFFGDVFTWGNFLVAYSGFVAILCRTQKIVDVWILTWLSVAIGRYFSR